MISLIAAALLAGPSMVLPVSDPQVRRLSDACVAAAEQDGGGLPAVRRTLNTMRVRREAKAWRLDYDVTLQARNGSEARWVGECTLAAPHVVIVASN